MNQQDAPLRGLRAPGPCSPPRSSPGSTSWRTARRFRGWMWTKARADGRAPARVCVAGLCGAGEGARAADNAGRGPAARRSPPFTACRSLFFLFGPRPTRFEGRGIHLKPLGDRSSQGSDGRAAAALPGSLWCLARASSTGRPGFKCLFLSVSSVSKRRRGEVAADRTRLRRDISAGGRPLIKGREPEEEPLALPFFCGAASRRHCAGRGAALVPHRPSFVCAEWSGRGAPGKPRSAVADLPLAAKGESGLQERETLG